MNTSDALEKILSLSKLTTDENSTLKQFNIPYFQELNFHAIDKNSKIKLSKKGYNLFLN